MGGVRRGGPFPWLCLQDGRSQGAPRGKMGVECVIQAPCQEHCALPHRGTKERSLEGSDSWPCQPRTQAKRSPEGHLGGQGAGLVSDSLLSDTIPP